MTNEPMVQIPLSLARSVKLSLSLLVELFDTDEAKGIVRHELKQIDDAIANRAQQITQDQYADTVNPLRRPSND